MGGHGQGRYALRATTGVGEAGVAQAEGQQLLPVKALYLIRGDGLGGKIIREGLRLTETVGAGQHGIEAGEIAGEVGEGPLYLGDELLYGGERAVAHGAVEDAAAAVDDAEQHEAVHGAAEAHIAEVGEAGPAHAVGAVGVHAGIRLPRHGLAAVENAHHQQTGQGLLQVDAQAAVRLLYLLVQALEGAAEHGGQQGQHCAGGQDNGGQTRFDVQQHRCGGDETHQHPGGAGQYLAPWWSATTVVSEVRRLSHSPE